MQFGSNITVRMLVCICVMPANKCTSTSGLAELLPTAIAYACLYRFRAMFLREFAMHVFSRY